MKKIFLSFFIGLIFPLVSFGYDDQTTHPGITEQVVEFFNLNNEVKISSADKELIIQGSIDEDNNPGTRPLNHFYEPQRQMGINNYRNAIQWVTEVNNGNEFTWDKSIAKYASGDREGALVGLGHILHLAEDMTVPDHTRNDPHIGTEGIAAWSNTGDSLYENWAQEYKTRAAMKGIAVDYFRMGYKTRYVGSTIADFFENIAGYSNNNYVSPDTINTYSFPEVTSKRGGYAFGEDYYFYDMHKLYIDLITKKGEEIKSLTYIGNGNNDYSVLEDYFNRLVKMAILSGAGITEMFMTEAERARAEYLEAEKLKLEKETSLEAERLAKLTEGSIFSQLWYRLNFAVTDTAGAIAGAVVNTVTDFGHTIYGGTALAANNISNAVNGINYTGNEVAAIGVQKVEQGVRTARVAVVSTAQKVILYVKENTSDLSALVPPAVAYTPPPPVLTFDQIIEIVSVLSTPENTNTGENNITPKNTDTQPTHHSRHSDPVPQATSTEDIATTTIIYEQVSPPSILSAIDITNTTPTTTILFSGTSTQDFIITTDFATTSTSTDSFGNWSLAIENISEGTTTLNFYAEPDILHSSSTSFASSTKVTTITDYIKSASTTATVFVASAPAVNISVPAPVQCGDSLLTDRCLITTEELEMSWNSTSPNISYYTIIINDDPEDTSTTTETSGILELYDKTENTIEIFATDNTGLESEHIIYEVIVYWEPVSAVPDWSNDSYSAINSQIILHNNTPYDLNIENWVLLSEDGSFNITLTEQIKKNGEYVLIKDSGSGEEITGADQTYIQTLTRAHNFLYLKRLGEIIFDEFLGVDDGGVPC
jgi:hypothetical protein